MALRINLSIPFVRHIAKEKGSGYTQRTKDSLKFEEVSKKREMG